ncbi:glycoside hydrolase family protein [Nostoc sp. CHAB 5714]|uniref:Glycoside hydrolase family protein n=1 Tax=Nostoc favosum CHAB5714 TaxID=2780399 RepID=A0ABS8I7Y9_9NOSO|nr:glycoside hydrolase family protein [Nostoc favosum]MCC5599819.1 glycoside hydrolase family protein [Nostoc favosum CHAB5714]
MAAGRYQILTTTWQEKVKKYHKFSKSLSIAPESFEPQIQDEVVYAWLSDHHAWRADITTLLKQKKLNQVLQILSGTWTSLALFYHFCQRIIWDTYSIRLLPKKLDLGHSIRK